MAKKNVSTTFEHATINCDSMTITEETKDGVVCYSLYDVLREWHGIENVSLSLKHSAVLLGAEVGEDE